MPKIGFVGTGIMASGMIINYLKAGYLVAVWNRSQERLKPLLEAGATSTVSPREVAEQSDIVFEVTANDESSQAVWQGEQGMLAGADAKTVLIASATLSAGWTDQLAQLCVDQGFTFFDMPLTGGRVAAEDGTLTLLSGGDEARLEVLKPELEAISSKVYYFGKAGSGMRYKLILNSLQAAHLVAFGEAMKLAETQGLDLKKVGEALCGRPGGVMTTIAQEAYQKDVTPLTFSVDWITKDLEYAKRMNNGSALPILDDVLAAYKKTQQKGHGSDDWTIVNK